MGRDFFGKVEHFLMRYAKSVQDKNLDPDLDPSIRSEKSFRIHNTDKIAPSVHYCYNWSMFTSETYRIVTAATPPTFLKMHRDIGCDDAMMLTFSDWFPSSKVV
jgi:hypothetical protein